MKILNSKNIALVYKDRELSYSDLIGSVNHIVGSLELKGKVALFMENRSEWVLSFFSIWSSNATAVLIDVMSNASEVEYILKDSRPTSIFVSNDSIDTAKEAIKNSKLKIDIINVDDLEFKVESSLDMLDYSGKSLDETAVLIYTSGTTGEPKGVMLSFGNLFSNVDSMVNSGIMKRGDSILALLFFHHSYPLMALILTPLSLSAKIVISATVGSDEIFRLLNSYRISIVIGVPRLYSLMAKGIMKKIDANVWSKRLYNLMKRVNIKWLRKLVFNRVQKRFGGNIKAFVSGGAKLDIDVANALRVFGFTMLEGYGLTETSPVIANETLKSSRLGSVGRPLKDVEVKIEEGEILVKGPNVMKGYYNREEATNEVIVDGWFHTGDLGRLDRDGYLYITGRKKEMIVLPNGKNINPVAIEDKILSTTPQIKEIGIFEHEGVLSAIVYPDFDLISEMKLLNIDEDIRWKLTSNYNTAAPDYRKIGKYYIVKEELPKTRLGKLRRFMLPALIKKNVIKRDEDENHPDSEVYRMIKDYIESVTKKEVYPSSHVEVDLGLDSIDKVDLQSFIEKSFGITISAEEMVDMMEIDAFYKYVDKSKKFVKKIDLNSVRVSQKREEETLQEIEEAVLEEKVDLNKTSLPFIRLVRTILRSLFKLLFKLEVEGLENIPKDGNFIMAPNHQSFLDVQLLSSIIPVDIAKDTYSLAYYANFESNVMKYIANNMNVITVDIDKNLKETIEKLEYVLYKKKNLLIFPEGYITRDGNLLPLKPLFAMLSKNMNIPILPVIIDGSRRALPYGSAIPKPGKIKVKFLKPVTVEKFKEYREILDHMTKIFEEELK